MGKMGRLGRFSGLLLGAFVLLSGGESKAQSTSLVLPSVYQTQEGESYTTFPFGRSTAVRDQYYFEKKLFASSFKLTGISYRNEGGTSYRKKLVELAIYASTSKIANARSVKNYFHLNQGSSVVNVFTRKKIELPASTAKTGPKAFSVSLVFDKPFVYDPKLGGLLLDLVVYGQQPGRYDLDLGSKVTSRKASFGAPGCKGSNGKSPVADTPTTALKPGGAFVFRVRDLLPSAFAAILVGSREGGSWGALKLPFDLTAFGAAGCSLNTDILLLLPGQAGSTGELRVAGFVPNQSSLVGQWLLFQGLGFDKKANALGLVLTKGAKTEIAGSVPVARLLATSATALIGTLQVGAIPVMELRRN